MSNHTLGIVQARMGSSRLYGKILYPLQGTPLLAVLARRVARAQVEQWWLATTRQPEDDLTASWGEALGWNVYRGSTRDVLSRFGHIIRKENPEYVVRITADDPFTDYQVIDLMLEQARGMSQKHSLLFAGQKAGLPLGYAQGVVVAQRLLESEAEIPEDMPYHRSHVISWLVEQGEYTEFVSPEHWPARPGWRWTVDTLQDFSMARAAFEAFGNKWPWISYPEMAAILDNRPDITAINAGVRQKKTEES